jgi:phenylpropionate dioxygenase-like ring-hydroxylating dioxygenase large terminal subunit
MVEQSMSHIDVLPPAPAAPPVVATVLVPPEPPVLISTAPSAQPKVDACSTSTPMDKPHPMTRQFFPPSMGPKLSCSWSQGRGRKNGRLVRRPLESNNPPVDGNGEPAIAERASVARVTRAWYILCESHELEAGPLARTLFGQPLVLFREADGQPATLLDRCAHRNVPLSFGRVVDCRVECAYHGWQYDGRGDCKRIPGLLGTPELPRRAVPSHATREQDGYVWVYGTADVEPLEEPYRLPALDAPGYTTVRRAVEAEATLHATVENALDVPHTAFLHRGLFRGTGKTNTVTAVLSRDATSVTTEYLGEPRPEGLVGRILSPSGGVVTHFDRFILPSIAQVEYRIGEENHILVTSIGTPVEDFRTRLYAVVTFRSRFPGWLVKLALNPVAMKIFRQDAAMLRIQTDAIRRFGGEHYTSTEIDLMGPQIWRLLRRAELGKPPKEGDNAWRREIELEV